MSDTGFADKIKNGTVEIKKGKVFVTNPSPGGKCAVILPSDQVDIYVDGKLIKEKTAVSAENNIKILGKETPGTYKIDISVDKAKMNVYLAVEVVQGTKYVVNDCGPSEEVVITCEEYKVSPAPLNPEEVLSALRKRGVTNGIDREAVERAIRIPTGEAVLVATGTEPEKGEDARIEACFQDGEYQEKSTNALWVDNFDYGLIASIEAGEVIARKIPAKPGKPGMDVTGRKLDPPGTRDVQLKAGPGAKLSAGGNEAIATINGRPMLRGSTASVITVYKVKGNVDKKTGNINFSGDVVVEGNVLDAMKVRAGGSVRIEGYTTHCRIEAGGDIIIGKNAVGCVIKAGGANVYLMPLWEKLVSVRETVGELNKSLRQFFADPRILDRPEIKKYGPGAVLRLLLDTRFNGLVLEIRELDEMLSALTASSKAVFENSLSPGVTNLRKHFSGTGPLQFRTTNEILKTVEEFLKCSGTGLETIEMTLKDKASITLGNAQNSTLQATGDVIIKGRGCYNTNIVSGGNVIAREKNSFFRGGKIKAEGNIEIYELGSSGGAVTYVEVPSNKTITSVVTHQGLTIKQGSAVKIVGVKVGDL